MIALAALAIVLALDVSATDYSQAVETSRQRSSSLAQGLLFFLAGPVLAAGAVSGACLRNFSRKATRAAGS